MKKPITDATATGIINAKDVGAIGDGKADDTAAVQRAIDEASRLGVEANAARTGGRVYLPSGSYRITAPLKNNTLYTSVGLVGAGPRSAQLFGVDINGYTVDQVPENAGKIASVEGLFIRNTSNNKASGALRMNTRAVSCYVHQCWLSGNYNALDCAPESFNLNVSDCDITCGTDPPQVGSVGAYMAQSALNNCVFSGWDVATQVHNVGWYSSGSRWEVNNTAIVLGRNRASESHQICGFQLTGASFERNDTALDIVNASGGVISSLAITGTLSPEGDRPGQYGIRMRHANSVMLTGIIVSMYCTEGSIVLNEAGSAARVVLAGVLGRDQSGTGPGWVMPTTNREAFTFIGCDEPKEGTEP